jgi:hypothetical protein
MKLFAAYLFFLIPCFTLAQLFPKMADFKGHIEKITEKRYGKELNKAGKDSGVFKPKVFSGWKYIYQFDENSKLASRTDQYQGKIISEYRFERHTNGNQFTERQIIEKNPEGESGGYLEYENFLDSLGRIVKVNYWAYEPGKKLRELFLVEMNPEYKNNRLMAFTRYNIQANGEMDSGEKCSLFYDNEGRLIRLERKDIVSDFKTVIDYNYNEHGLIMRYAIDYLLGFREYEKNPKQDIFFKFDNNGNWTRKYLVTDDKKRLESKRLISYK